MGCEILLNDLKKVGFYELENKVDIGFVLEDVLKFNNVFVFERVE